MNRPTLLALNRINRAFYRTAAAGFSATRRSAWPGFARAGRHIHEALPGNAGARLLDLGCGNGRFADALLDELDERFSYLGVDASEALLAEPRARHGSRTGFRFLAHDFVVDPLCPALEALGQDCFHVILVLGVLHHVPGGATRQRLLLECARCLAPGGLLIFTLWRFEHLPRLMRRIVPWKDLPARGGPALDSADLEPGDYLLPFGPGEGSLRYCHTFGEPELQELLAALPLERLDTWLADGETGDLNRWWVLRRR